MSKTRKTRPYWVKLLDKPNFLEASHQCDTSDIECDLPEVANYRDHVTKCAWVPSGCTYDFGYMRCGCPMCTMQDWRHEQNRKERYAGRRYTRKGWHDEY